ncbi:thioesterase II family protein [Kitasatospora sp. NPDC096147]|uniref:thioesterase II family protein n=1 Tax=Kitasatospora sp. NPDC096147 TaxID=3364093 RepID=UPI00382801D2
MTAALRPAPTVHRPRPVAAPVLRLFLFHHAGGSHLFFREWCDLFPVDWEVVLVEAPGRGFGGTEPAYTELAPLVERFRTDLSSRLDVPYAFFGHSMGSLVATELARRIRAAGEPGPRWLGLSAWAADQERPGDGRPPRHLHSDEELREVLVRMGGTPAEVLDVPELWQLFAPAIRSDFQLVDTAPAELRAPLPELPQSLFAGLDDAVTPAAAVAALAERLPHLTGLHVHPGDHFYLREHRKVIARQIVEDLGGVLRGSAA